MAAEQRRIPDTVAPDDARILVAEHELAVIDVRDPDEFRAASVPGSTNLPDADADALIDELGGASRALIVSADGDRGAELAAAVRERDVEAASLEGGFDAWTSARMPIQPSPDFEREPEGAPKLPGVG